MDQAGQGSVTSDGDLSKWCEGRRARGAKIRLILAASALKGKASSVESYPSIGLP